MKSMSFCRGMISGMVAGLICGLASVSAVVAQEKVDTTSPVRTISAPVTAAEAESQPYQYIFFWKQDSAQKRAMQQLFVSTTAEMGSAVKASTVNIADPKNKATVDQYDVSRAPMPLVLSIAPNGAVTKASAVQFTADDLREGVVSHGSAQSMKALQDQKLVVMCVLNKNSSISESVHKNAMQFISDPRFAKVTELVVIEATDAGEQKLLQQLQVKPQSDEVVTVVMAPPGKQVARLTGLVTSAQLVAKVTEAQTSCCPGGKCGPNGQCCPGGKCPPAAPKK